MLKLVFIIYYEPKDYLLYIKEQFEKHHVTVLTYPLFRYAYDANDKIANYAENLHEFITANNPDMILWWFIDVPIDVFKYVTGKHPKRYFIIYNSDDPVNLNKNLFDICKLFDLVVTSCRGSVYKYHLFSRNKNVIFQPMGFDPTLFTPLDIAKQFPVEYAAYQCDISLYCNNLFVDRERYPFQYIYTIDLLRSICSWCTANNAVFKIYGAYGVKEFFPDNYVGNIEYHNLNFLYNASKINLVLHGDCTNSLVLNSNLMSVMAAGGVALTDPVRDLAEIIPTDSCVVINKTDYLQRIANILKNPEQRDVKKAVDAAGKYSWDAWVRAVMIRYGADNFDAALYADLYGYSPQDDLLQFWCETGCDRGEICYPFQVPDNFNITEYAAKYDIGDKSREYIYHHWFTHSKNEIFLTGHTKTNQVDYPKMGVNVDQYHKLCTIFAKIMKSSDKAKYMQELGVATGAMPTVDINAVLTQYLNAFMQQ